MYETTTVNRAFLVGLQTRSEPGKLDVDSSLEELAMLSSTAGIEVVGQTSQRINHPDPATYIGSGKVEEVRNWVNELGANTVIFDEELSPRHQRELEEAFDDDVRILDRTALILDIFAQHAHTKEGALQVELAQYEYLLPRLTRMWTHLARQAGGGAASGIGLRGPGETQLEVDRREIQRKITHLKREIELVRAHRERYRKRRKQEGIPVCALIGYTNAGKSTLLNRLSGASVYAADQLFATLDPTTRRVTLPDGQEALFTDTVGFIQKLPTGLVAAFRATLEEVTEADLLIHVVDISHPNAMEQAIAVEVTLTEDLGIEDLSLVVVLNKADRKDEIEPGVLRRLQDHYPDAILTSAITGDGIEEFLTAVSHRLLQEYVQITVNIPYQEADVISQFYEHARVESEVAHEAALELTGLIDPRLVRIYEKYT